MSHRLSVLLQTPAHSQLGGALTYRSESALAPGTLVRVPLGKRDVLGLVWDDDPALGQGLADDKLRSISTVLDGVAPLPPRWRELVTFTANYYQRSIGEVALAALPPQLRELNAAQWARRLKRHSSSAAPLAGASLPAAVLPALSAEQAAVVSEVERQDGPFLLFGATGSGKTEVYLRCVGRLLAREPQAQALVMVPEINLTPQLEARFFERFGALYGAHAVVCLHSGMTPAQRLGAWLAAHAGTARIVLGTRIAVFASLPGLRLIVVDEEHDPSYRGHDGAHYSARDLAVYRARLEGARVLLGSATPSLESWYHSRAAELGGRYVRLHMPSRIADDAGAVSAMPLVRRVDMNHQPKRCVFSPPLLQAIAERAARGEQSMVFLNRRGYAPVLYCTACDWKSQCPHCSAYRVFHKIDRSLRCHHCGLSEHVPRACPECGNVDIGTTGRGTEQLEEQLGALLAQACGANGQPLRVSRIDADSTRGKGALQAQLAQVHAGEVDVLVGTQMIAKGHDFRRITLVAALDADGALFSSDFRAPERLFALLMQAAGRAGRSAALGRVSEMWVQTHHPQHPLFDALKRYDYPAFAQSQLDERAQAGLPPFSFQALVRAHARTQAAAQAYLQLVSQAAAALPGREQVTLYPPVPMAMPRVANVERAQMLVESASRVALQRFLSAWSVALHAAREAPGAKGMLRWFVDVDPLSI